MRVLLTGPTGFIGHYLAHTLLAAGHEVKALIRPGHERRLGKLQRAVTPAYGDLTQPHTLVTAVEEVDAVINLVGIIREAPGSSFYRLHWEGAREATRAQLAQLMRERMRLSRAQLDATRRELVAKKQDVMATLATPWLDAEAKASAKVLFESFFSIIENDDRFYLPVVESADLQLLTASGEPDDICLANTIPTGTPILRHGVTNAALGIEEVSLLDVAWQLPCNKDRVWVQSNELRVGTNFPAR